MDKELSYNAKYKLNLPYKEYNDSIRKALGIKTKNGLARVSLPRRLFAFLIDLYVISILFFSPLNPIFRNFLGNTMFSTLKSLSSATLNQTLRIGIFYFSIISLLYLSLTITLTGQTLGLFFTGLRVDSKNGGNPSLLSSLLRNSFILPYFPFSFFLIIDPIYYIFRGERLLEKLSITKISYA